MLFDGSHRLHELIGRTLSVEDELLEFLKVNLDRLLAAISKAPVITKRIRPIQFLAEMRQAFSILFDIS